MDQQQQQQESQQQINENNNNNGIGPVHVPSSTTKSNGSNNNKYTSLNGAIAGNGTSSEEFLIGLSSGIVFGFVSPMIGHPFDSIKTRMQADPIYHNQNFRQTVVQIYRTNGILNGFYRGFIPPLIGSMAFRGLQFSVYAGAYSFYERNCSYFNTPIPYSGGLRPSVVFGALMATFARATIESPLDFIKVRKMVGQDAMHDTKNLVVNNGSTTTTNNKNIVLTEMKEFITSPIQSIKQLYRGYVPTLLRTFGLLGSFFIMVDYSVRYIPDVINAPGYGPFFKGGICATVAWIFAFPFESAKSVIQADTTGKYRTMSNATFHVLRDLYNERGIIHGIYRGFGPGAGRSFIANGTSMVVFAYVQDLIRSNLHEINNQ